MHRSSHRALIVTAAFVVMMVPIAAIAAPTFSDVPATDWAYDDIEWLAATGVTKGCGDGKYCPDAPVTRREMAAFIHRLATYRVVDAATVEGKTATELKGDPGVVGFYTIETYTAASTFGRHTGDAPCNAGDVATGGGVQLDVPSKDFSVLQSKPMHSGDDLPEGWTPTGWHGEVRLAIDLPSGHWGFRTWAVCADVTP